MPDHRVKRALERDVLPYLVSARRLRKQWFYRLHTMFGLTTDLVAALAAIGVGTPLLRFLAGTESGPDGSAATPGFAEMIAGSQLFVIPSILLIATWLVLRVVLNRENGQRRAVLARSCTQQMRQAQASLPAALATQDPMPALTNMLEKTIRPTVDRNIQDEAWPWEPFAPSIDGDVSRQLKELCDKYEKDWAPVDPLGLQQAPAAGCTP